MEQETQTQDVDAERLARERLSIIERIDVEQEEYSVENSYSYAIENLEKLLEQDYESEEDRQAKLLEVQEILHLYVDMILRINTPNPSTGYELYDEYRFI